MPSRGQAIDWTKVVGTSTDERLRWRPALSSAVVDGTELTLNYVDRITKWGTPPTDSYAVHVDGAERDVVRVRVEEYAVTLTLASAVKSGQKITVSYRPGRFAIRKIAWYEQPYKAAPISAVAVRNETESTNSPATGLPTVSGTAQVGETLTADTSTIVDEDGLDNATFSYQWSRNDGTADFDIADATGATYTLTADEQGKTLKVRVSFTDDTENEESLTSAETGQVSARPLSLDDFDAGDGQEVLASALIRVGDRGRKNDESQDRAWYATDTSGWHASGALLQGSLAWNDITLTRVTYFPDTGEFRFNEADSVHIGNSFAAGGVNRELTVWIRTATETVSFLARDNILNSGSGWMNFQSPQAERVTLGAIAKDDLIIIAVSVPANP